MKYSILRSRISWLAMFFVASAPGLLPAQSPTITLGPEIDVGITHQSGAYTQYQTDLRCNPINAQELSITCKYKGETETLVFSTKDGGTTWNRGSQPSSGDPDAVYDRDGRVHWTFIDKSSASKTGYRRSWDGGLTWEFKNVISGEGLDHMHVTTDRGAGIYGGSLYLAGRSLSGAALVTLRSRDAGNTWQSTRVALPAAVGAGFVQNILVMRDGTLIVPMKSKITVLSDSNGNYAGSRKEIFILRSVNGGVTLSAPIRVGDMNSPVHPGSPGSRSFSVASGMVGGVERLYLVFSREFDNQPSLLQLCTSDDKGATWTEPRTIIPATPAGWGQGGCVSAIVNSEGTLGVQFYNFKPGSISDFDLYFTASIDGGATFTIPTRVSTATSKHPAAQPREPGGDQVYADVAADGSFRLVWTDARGGAANYKVYHRSVRVNRTVPLEVILDNAATSGVTTVGAWTTSSATAGFYGVNYSHDGNTGKGSKSVTFTPNLVAGGNYDVSIRYCSARDRASNVPVEVQHQGGTSTVVLNQREGGGTWVFVGSYYFTAGNLGKVTISNAGTNGVVIVDAVRWMPK